MERSFFSYAAPEGLTSFEQDLVLSFQKHRLTGSRWYPRDLKTKVFQAFEEGIPPSRIVELCEIPSFLVYKWHGFFKQEQKQVRNPIESDVPLTPLFREVRVVDNQENSNPVFVDGKSHLRPQEEPYLKICFPNGVQITGSQELLSNKILSDIYNLKGG